MRKVVLATVLPAVLLSLGAAPAMAQRTRAATTAAGVTPDGAAPPTADYRGGAGSPLSTQATNIGSSRTEMGSRLPNPDASSDTPEALLRAASRSLDRGQTGAAQQALEMAETRVLSRTTAPDAAGMPDQNEMVKNIGAARMALGRKDVRGAKASIQMALNTPVPGPGPAVTTRTYIPGVPATPGVGPRGY